MDKQLDINNEQRLEAEYERGIVENSRAMRKKSAVEWCLKMKGLQCKDCDNKHCDFNYEGRAVV